MEVKELRALIDFISETGLAEVNIKTKEFELSVRRHPKQVVRNADAPVVAAPVVVPATQVAAAEKPKEVAPVTPKAEIPAVPQVDESKLVAIKAPMIGTFYRATSPENPPLVKVGDKITKGQTVCIIEAMKLFNEIESDVNGTIVKVGVENASPVEYDQVLFLVEPA
jgi:acetyl-CoA carboxylase biotin carboxyl carrier protein